MRNHVVFFSGGGASLAVADYVLSRFPEDNIVLYFTDTLWESPDLYRMTAEASDKLKLPLLTHSAGLTPVQLMFEKKLLFNSLIGDCSKILKMKVASDFLKKGLRPVVEHWRNKAFLKHPDFISEATIYFGIGFDEMHREPAIRKNWLPFQVDMPLIENNIFIDQAFKKWNIRKPVLYEYGFAHNNCNGRCVKAGQGHYRLLREKMPDVFEEIKTQEYHLKMCVSAYRYIIDDKCPEEDRIPEHVREQMLAELDDAYRDYFYGRAKKPKIYIHPAASAACRYMKVQEYSFMKRPGKTPVLRTKVLPNGDQRSVKTYPSEPYSLRSLAQDIENDGQIDMFDIGGCGCFAEGM